MRSQRSLNKSFAEALGELFIVSGYATTRPLIWISRRNGGQSDLLRTGLRLAGEGERLFWWEAPSLSEHKKPFGFSGGSAVRALEIPVQSDSVGF